MYGSKLPILVKMAGNLSGQGQLSLGEEKADMTIPIYRIAGSGDCYIHGLMDGEALEISEAEDNLCLGHVALI